MKETYMEFNLSELKYALDFATNQEPQKVMIVENQDDNKKYIFISDDEELGSTPLHKNISKELKTKEIIGLAATYRRHGLAGIISG